MLSKIKKWLKADINADEIIELEKEINKGIIVDPIKEKTANEVKIEYEAKIKEINDANAKVIADMKNEQNKPLDHNALKDSFNIYESKKN